jgi:hypothetical protein
VVAAVVDKSASLRLELLVVLVVVVRTQLEELETLHR